MKSIDSVIGQTFDKWTLIIVGDGYEMDFVPDDARIQFVSLKGPNNDNGTAARNVGIQCSTYGWITYIDDDDVWENFHLESLAVEIEMAQNNDVKLDAMRTYGRPFMWKHRHPRSSKLKKVYGEVNEFDVLTPGMCHSREMYNLAGPWINEDNHDHLLWEKMMRCGAGYVVIPKVTFEFER